VHPCAPDTKELVQWGLIIVIFKSCACLSNSKPIEIKLSSKDLMEAFKDNSEFNMYLSKKPY
jgi:hypothetical protein